MFSPSMYPKDENGIHDQVERKAIKKGNLTLSENERSTYPSLYETYDNNSF